MSGTTAEMVAVLVAADADVAAAVHRAHFTDPNETHRSAMSALWWLLLQGCEPGETMPVDDGIRLLDILQDAGVIGIRARVSRTTTVWLNQEIIDLWCPTAAVDDRLWHSHARADATERTETLQRMIRDAHHADRADPSDDGHLPGS